MRKYIFLTIPILALIVVSAPRAHASFNGYTYQRTITVSSTLVAPSGTSLSSFPIEVSSTLSDMKSVANGGTIQNLSTSTVSGITVPDDLIFSTSTTCNATSSWEIEKYVSSTGEIEAWVNNGALSSSTGLTFYECYANSSITTFQASTTKVWDSNYIGVYHFPSSNGYGLKDSTANNNNLANNATSTSVAGQIDGGAAFNGSSYLTATLNIGIGVVNTIEGWLNSTVNNAQDYMAMLEGGAEALTGQNNGSSIGADCFFGSAFVCNGSAFTTGQWYQFANTRNGSAASGYIMYINGNPVQVTTRASTDGTSTTLFIGANTSAGSKWNGNLDEIRVSNIVRSQDWIKTGYNNGINPSNFLAISNAVSGAATPPTRRIGHGIIRPNR